MKLVIVEDHMLMQEFVRRVCSQMPDVAIAAESKTGADAVVQIIRAEPDALILDIELPDIDGLEVLHRIRNLKRDPKVLVMSAHISPYLVARLEESHVMGFFDKRSQTVGALSAAITALKLGQRSFSPSYTERLNYLRRDEMSFVKLLTKQEILVLAKLSKFDDDEGIGKALEISVRTVETHRTSLMKKLGLHSRAELIHYGARQGFF